ncbi:MAG: sugar-transfer associated ATP-grasp domain-containing protein [Gemmatimonadaceae bacterium]
MRQARQVEAARGKSVTGQLREIAALRRGPGRLLPGEYYDMGLFDDDRYSPSAKREFVGSQSNREIDRQLNHPQWRAIADSKLVCSAMLEGLGFATPRTHVLYRPDGRSTPRLECLRTPEELAEYLRTRLPYPVFAKPVRSHLGEGAFRISGYDAASDRILFDSGEATSVRDFVGQVDDFQNTRQYGYIFQEPICQHPVLNRIFAPCVGTMRMVVALDRRGPWLVRVIFRVPRSHATTDNLVGATAGNMAGAVDIATGTVTRVIAGKGLEEREVETHPDSGVSLRGMRVPLWDRCVATVLDAASVLPGLQLQHWDVAIGPDGPVLVEVNYAGGGMVSQAAYQQGMLSPYFREFLSMHAGEYRV